MKRFKTKAVKFVCFFLIFLIGCLFYATEFFVIFQNKLLASPLLSFDLQSWPWVVNLWPEFWAMCPWLWIIMSLKLGDRKLWCHNWISNLNCRVGKRLKQKQDSTINQIFRPKKGFLIRGSPSLLPSTILFSTCAPGRAWGVPPPYTNPEESATPWLRIGAVLKVNTKSY